MLTVLVIWLIGAIIGITLMCYDHLITFGYITFGDLAFFSIISLILGPLSIFVMIFVFLSNKLDKTDLWNKTIFTRENKLLK
jgi:hypothetical protein